MRPGPSSRRGIRGGIGSAPAPLQFGFSAGTGRLRVWGTVFLSHEGLAVNLVGGDVPHIGAVAISIPRPSLATPRRQSATTSVFAVVGHKEDELARPIATDLATALGRTTVVVAGVHVHRGRPADFVKIFENAGRAAEEIITKVRASGRNPAHPEQTISADPRRGRVPVPGRQPGRRKQP